MFTFAVVNPWLLCSFRYVLSFKIQFVCCSLLSIGPPHVCLLWLFPSTTTCRDQEILCLSGRAECYESIWHCRYLFYPSRLLPFPPPLCVCKKGIWGTEYAGRSRTSVVGSCALIKIEQIQYRFRDFYFVVRNIWWQRRDQLNFGDDSSFFFIRTYFCSRVIRRENRSFSVVATRFSSVSFVDVRNLTYVNTESSFLRKRNSFIVSHERI